MSVPEIDVSLRDNARCYFEANCTRFSRGQFTFAVGRYSSTYTSYRRTNLELVRGPMWGTFSSIEMCPIMRSYLRGSHRKHVHATVPRFPRMRAHT